MKANKSVIMLCLLLFSISGNVFAQWENTGDVRIAEQSISKIDSLLKINLKIDLSDLAVQSNLAVDIIPVLLGRDEQTLRLPKLLVTGRNRHIVFQRMPQKETEGQREVRRYNKEEQYADYTISIPYQKWMGRASLSLVLDLCGCGWDVLANKRMGVTDITINDQADYIPVLAYRVPAKEIKIRQKSGQANLDFPVNKIKIFPNYRNNVAELGKIQATIDSVRNDPNATITSVAVRGYASPEGSYRHNAYLAEHRTQALLQYVRDLYHFRDAEFTQSFEPEDWKGLEEMVVNSAIPHRDEVLAIIGDKAITDPDLRDRRLKELHGGLPYRHLLDIFYPALRRSEYVVTYTIRPFDTEEAKGLLYTDPKQLSLEEMYRIAKTYEPGSEAFNDVFNIAVRMYPKDPAANLNAANAALMRRDVATARKYLDRAPACGEKLLALGAMALYEGNKQSAEQYFKEAKAAGMTEAEVNLKFLQYIP